MGTRLAVGLLTQRFAGLLDSSIFGVVLFSEPTAAKEAGTTVGVRR